MAQPIDPENTMMGFNQPKVNDDLTFEIGGLSEPRLIRANLGGTTDWALKAVLFRDQDVTDTPIDFVPGRDVEGIEIVFTRKRTDISGAVTNERGEIDTDATVVIFSADRERWTTMTRFVRTARPAQDGRYSLKGMPPHDYLVVAVRNVEMGQWQDPDFLESIRDQAVRVSLGEGETKVQDLKVAKLVTASGGRMVRRALPLVIALLLAVPATSGAQMTFRLRGTVRDNAGKPVAGSKVRAEALQGFRGEQFVGQKDFEVTTGANGEWVILGLTSGIWAFEATGPEIVPQVVVLPVNFTNRKPQSAQGGTLSWDLPLVVRRTKNEMLTRAAEAAVAKKTDEAVAAISGLLGDQDQEVVCAAGELALFVRQNGLASALFNQILKTQPKHTCATLGAASSALMQGNLDLASRMLWTATDVAPRDLKPAFGAAVRDLQQVAGVK